MENLDEKQVAIKLSEKNISRLDDLARRGHTNRRQLMLNFIKIWIDELRETSSVNYFHLAIILREVEAEINNDLGRRSEFVESFFPEKQLPMPIILTEDDYLYIISCSGRANMTKHHIMKNMIITGIDELEELTDNKEYDFSVVESKLKGTFGVIMAKGFRAFKEGIREKKPLKRQKYE